MRKTKELADDRYRYDVINSLLRHFETCSRDEQKAKTKLRDIMTERAKLIETVTQQDGIVRGLESERSRWSRDLADRTSSLAQEKS